MAHEKWIESFKQMKEIKLGLKVINGLMRH